MKVNLFYLYKDFILLIHFFNVPPTFEKVTRKEEFLFVDIHFIRLYYVPESRYAYEVCMLYFSAHLDSKKGLKPPVFTNSI